MMDWDASLIALRDFFAARDGQALAAACADMAKAAAPSSDRPPAKADALEFAFNRLFVGPGHVPAPPYASVYLDSGGKLMGDATRMAAAVYDTLGLTSPLAGSLPDDHLALELDAALALRRLRNLQPSAEIAALWRYFLEDHLALWVPLFVTRVAAFPNLDPRIRDAVALLSAWLSEETRAIAGDSAPMMFQPGETA